MQDNLSFSDGTDFDSELGQLDTFENDIQKAFKPLRSNEYFLDIKSSFENTNKSFQSKIIKPSSFYNSISRNKYSTRNQDREMLSIVIPFGKGKTFPLKFASIDRKKSFLDNIGFNYDYLKEYSFIKEIAKGTYGSIYLATKDSKEYSIKIIKKKNNVTQQLRREIYINQFLTQHKHNNIINVYDVYETGDYVYIIMEHITTQNFTSKNYQDFFNSNQSIKESYMRQLIEGVNFLHENGIIHRDIKFDNILIQNTKELSIKIIDFWLSILLCK